MLVKPQCIGRRITGIYIGASNVRRYFPRHMVAIDLEIDHLRIRCTLHPDFWQDDPEIRDSRLSDWLELKQVRTAGKKTPIMLSMIPSGEESFVLGTAVPAEHKRVHAVAVPQHTDIHAITALTAYRPLGSPATAA
jgi:hypothetical protein